MAEAVAACVLVPGAAWPCQEAAVAEGLRLEVAALEAVERDAQEGAEAEAEAEVEAVAEGEGAEAEAEGAREAVLQADQCAWRNFTVPL